MKLFTNIHDDAKTWVGICINQVEQPKWAADTQVLVYEKSVLLFWRAYSQV
jgi:hypothetical protein